MISTLLSQALDKTYASARAEEGGATVGKNHARLSEMWIEALACEFRRYYGNSDGYRVFSKKFTGNKPAFPIQEYLFDVTVFKTKKIDSASGRVDLECPYEILWHVESEFQSNNSRASIMDFGKLMMSGAENRLLILPSGGKIQRWANDHLPSLKNETPGTMWLAFVPHPREWLISSMPPEAKVKKIW